MIKKPEYVCHLHHIAVTITCVESAEPKTWIKRKSDKKKISLFIAFFVVLSSLSPAAGDIKEIPLRASALLYDPIQARRAGFQAKTLLFMGFSPGFGD